MVINITALYIDVITYIYTLNTLNMLEQKLIEDHYWSHL